MPMHSQAFPRSWDASLSSACLVPCHSVFDKADNYGHNSASSSAADHLADDGSNIEATARCSGEWRNKCSEELPTAQATDCPCYRVVADGSKAGTLFIAAPAAFPPRMPAMT